ncbi:NAD(P)/FAD-dependent oxidoreductase [Brevundimonas pondensis]|uniref:FAD-dependent oxidoreductase n=1 Tax=Brevundimonas pondensis TaxID=2774189 RepID=A0ABX7SP63_9CAUL|nr:FAD-dependent oxidoreductase [Brevundimonas pondensis]QTC88926.1 FAD-dependent oxidoreductase [Brevundimonas pondensis]
MPLFNSQDIAVIGAGVLGLCTAAELARRGHVVTVVDPGGLNASAVAAGMIAPAMESAVDDLSPEHAALLRRARDAWVDFAAATGVRLDRDPAEWRGGNVEVLAGRLAALGFEQVYDREAGRLTTREDWKVEPAQALAALTQGVRRLEGRATALSRTDGRWHVETTAGSVEADQVVLAIGAEAAPDGLPEAATRLLALISPIRGQIGLVAEGLVDHVVRGPGAYVAPMGQGCVIGATMEAGERSLTPDPERCAQMLGAAWAVLGQTPRPLQVDWRAGVRGATPDGLPMAGAAGQGLHLALGPRRNGWLLGPLVARVVADEVEGRSSKEPTLAPRRFT